MYNSIRSYDIDYSKFRLGYIDILKQLDWCFKNNYKVFDLGRGDLDYKRRWCNVVYDFEHHIIYQKNYLDKRILAFTSTKFYVLKEFLKKKEIHILYHKVKFIFKKKPQNKTKYAEHTFEINDIIKIPLNEKILKIDIDSEEYSFLRKPVYDFQYINFESSIDVTLFKIKDVYDSYLIIGKNKQQIITDKTAQDQNKSLNNTN